MFHHGTQYRQLRQFPPGHGPVVETVRLFIQHLKRYSKSTVPPHVLERSADDWLPTLLHDTLPQEVARRVTLPNAMPVPT
eukprot:gene2371-256_t